MQSRTRGAHTRTIRSTILALFVALVATMLVTVAAPSFRMPFPCGQRWQANNTNSSAHERYELDFNRGSTAYADRGHTVVAAAAGTVVTAANQGTSNGFGNLVKVDHGNGWYTYYAHLHTMAVRRGETVLQGQPIGSVGNTSYRNITPHLHYEIRYGSGYPSNIRRVPGYDYSRGGTQTMRSTNCGSRRDPRGLCGGRYVVNDSHRLGNKGFVVLTWNAAERKNCVVTLKRGNLGTRTWVAARLRPQGSSLARDAGNFYEYAGPVRRVAPTCVRWGGNIDGTYWMSGWEHC